MAKKKKPNYKSETGYETSQLDFLQQFRFDDVPTKPSYTRAIALYDAFPKFVFGGKNSEKRDTIGFDEGITTEIEFEGQTWVFRKEPAKVESRDGKTGFFGYPGEREELISRALRYLSVQGRTNPTSYWIDQNQEPEPPQARVAFTLGDLQRLLRGWGHTFSYSEIEEAIDVLLGARITVTLKGENDGYVAFKGMMLKDTFDASDGATKRRAVALNELELDAIRRGAYRAINIKRLMSFQKPLERRLYEFIMIRNRGAEKPKPGIKPRPFAIRLSTILNECCIDQVESNLSLTRKRVRNAFDALKEKGVLHAEYGYEEADPELEPTKGRARIKDITWFLYMSEETVRDIIAAHKEAWPATAEGQKILQSPETIKRHRLHAAKDNLK